MMMLMMLLMLMLLPCFKASDLSICSSHRTLCLSAFLRPHLQQESTEAEESWPADSARWRCADGGDELFGGCVGFKSICLPKKGPFRTSFMFASKMLVFVKLSIVVNGKSWTLLFTFVYTEILRAYDKESPQLTGLALLGVSVLHKRNFACRSYLLGSLGVCNLPAFTYSGLKWHMRICLQGKLGQMVWKTFVRLYVDQLSRVPFPKWAYYAVYCCCVNHST